MDQSEPVSVSHASNACRDVISQANSTCEKPTSPDGWSICAQTVQKYDEAVVKNWKEEIDTLLVFVRVADVFLPAGCLTGH